jgi:hypothetical protein
MARHLRLLMYIAKPFSQPSCFTTHALAIVRVIKIYACGYLTLGRAHWPAALFVFQDYAFS